METDMTANQPKRREGKVTKAIESTTSHMPSDAWLWTAVGTMGLALTLQAMGKKHLSLFFGQWVAPFLLFGIYNKIVKVAGSDAAEKEQQLQ